MGQVIDIGAWREARSDGPSRDGSAPVEQAPAAEELDRLERAVQRLQPLVSRSLGGQRRLGANVETELLAIIGELTMGLVQEATRRTERLAQRLAIGGARSR